jgi:hypothetical protein
MLKTFTLLGLLMLSASALSMDKAIEVSFFKLVNEPAKYLGKRITLVGYLSRLDDACGEVAYDGNTQKLDKNYEMVVFCLSGKLKEKYSKLSSNIISLTGIFFNDENKCGDIIRHGRSGKYLGCLNDTDYLYDIHPDVDPGLMPPPRKIN